MNKGSAKNKSKQENKKALHVIETSTKGKEVVGHASEVHVKGKEVEVQDSRVLKVGYSSKVIEGTLSLIQRTTKKGKKSFHNTLLRDPKGGVKKLLGYPRNQKKIQVESIPNELATQALCLLEVPEGMNFKEKETIMQKMIDVKVHPPNDRTVSGNAEVEMMTGEYYEKEKVE